MMILCFSVALVLLDSTIALSTTTASTGRRPDVSEILTLQKSYLRNNNADDDNDDSSPWCYVASIDPTKEITIPTNNMKYNFLATQVWPSARTASFFLERHIKTICNWKVCELGCGPALPSIVIANLGLPQVIATDIDVVALEMVEKAAKEQNLHNLKTKYVDLTCDDDSMSIIQNINAELYIMSDVFENANVARGAAKMTMSALQFGSRVWTFAQADRAQREIYLSELQHLGADKYCVAADDDVLEWKNSIGINEEDLRNNPLILFDLDEITVDYG